MLSRIRNLVTIGIKAVTHLRNHVHFMLHSIHRRYPGVRIIVADDEYVGVAREEWRRLTDLMNDYNVTYVQLVPRVGLSAGRNALIEACNTPVSCQRLNRFPHTTLSHAANPHNAHPACRSR